MPLSDDDRKRLRALDDTNRAKLAAEKLAAGKPLSREERTLLGLDENPVPTRSGFAKTWDALALALGVSRKSLQNWRANPKLKPHLPRPQADGRHDVAQWAAFMITHRLKRADEHVGPVGDSPADFDPDGEDTGIIQPPPIGGCAADWNKAGAMIDYERNKLKLETQRGTLLVAAELEVPLGATFVVLSQKFSQFPERIAPQIVGFVEVPEIIAIVRTEIESDLGELHGARYVNLTLARILDELPFDAESTRLLQLVSFEGQDKSALRELIARVALETLRTIGARAIAEITTGDPTAAPNAEVASFAAANVSADAAPGPFPEVKGSQSVAARSSKVDAGKSSSSPRKADRKSRARARRKPSPKE